MKKQKLTLLALAAGLGLAGSVYGQIAIFDFTGGSFADSAGSTKLAVSDVSTDATGGTDGFNVFTSTSGWDSAAQISGAGNFFSTPTTLAAAGNAIIFTITANSGYEFSISEFSFQARSTGAAPADIGFTINGTPYDFSESYSNDDVITTVSQNSLGYTGLSTATISIQGWNSSGSSSLQLDSIQVTGSAVPEPGSFALIAGCLGMVSIMLKRRRT